MDAYMNQMILLLRGFAFVSMTLALLHAVHDYRQGQNVTKYIVYLLCLTAFLASYNTILDYGCKMFESGVNEARQNTFAIWDEVDAGLTQKSTTLGGFIDKYVTLPLAKGLLSCCRAFYWLSGLAQEVFKIIYRMSAPLAIGLAAWRVFIPTGLRFAVGTLWLCTWSVGCYIADTILGKMTEAIFLKSLLTGAEGAAGVVATKVVVTGASKGILAAVGTAAIWTIFFALIIFLITAIMLYILIPISLYHIICAGDVVQGATHTMTGAFGAGMAANNAIYKTFGKGSGSGSGGGSGNSSQTSGSTATAGSDSTGNSSGSGGFGSGSSSGSGTKAARSHAALAESAERQLANRA